MVIHNRLSEMHSSVSPVLALPKEQRSRPPGHLYNSRCVGGATLTSRPELRTILDFVHPGEMPVVSRKYRLACSTRVLPGHRRDTRGYGSLSCRFRTARGHLDHGGPTRKPGLPGVWLPAEVAREPEIARESVYQTREDMKINAQRSRRDGGYILRCRQRSFSAAPYVHFRFDQARTGRFIPCLHRHSNETHRQGRSSEVDA